MREEVAEGDPLLAVRRELRQVPRHRVVEVEEPALPEPRQGDRNDRLGRRLPERERVAAERHAGPVRPHRRVGHRLAA